MAKPDPTDRMLDELLKGKRPEEILGNEGVLRDLTKRLVERALQGEMTAHLGYEKHASEGRDGGNSRNGSSSKRVEADFGEVEIAVPRDRAGDFDPQLVRKGQRRLAGFDEKVLALYARGMTVREIQGHLHELYGVEVSPTLISDVTDAVLEDVKAWQSRPLEPVYPILYLDAIFIKQRSNGHVRSQAVYVALGITLEGQKDLLGLWMADSEGAKFWLNVLTELKNRGMRDVLIACVDGLSGFPEAIESVFPQTEIQLCIVHMIRNSLRYVSWKQRKEVAADLRLVYTAPTAEAAAQALEEFAAKWDDRFPSIAKIWRRRWENVTPFFAYPPEIRKVIYTTSAIESINAAIRKVTKKRGAFPTPDAIRKVLYLAILKASERWSRPIKDWRAALNHFAIVFGDMVPS